jgi:serine/threonine-protein kinase
MAEVHEGRDLRLGRRVAIKILRPDLARDPAFQARFRREAQSAASLNHPNIVAVYDTGEDTLEGEAGGKVVVPYIVMEYVDGLTLRQLLASGRRLLPERALEIAAGVLSALDYAHRHGIVHRDIKPANVMLTRTGDVKVMDFGIARAVNDIGTTMTAASAVMGTAQYLSPEQARGEVVDARSDLYSTGVLLYELLTGKPPFTGDSPVAIAYQHVSEMPVPPSQLDREVTPDLDAVVLRALAKRPDDRYETAAGFRSDLDRALAGVPVTAAVPAITEDYTAQMPPIEASGNDRPSAAQYRQRPGFVRTAVFMVIALIAMAAAGFGGSLIWSTVFTRTDIAQVQVPELGGLTLQQAETTLQRAGLSLGAQTVAPSQLPLDTVVSQQPAAGEFLDQGQPVDVVLSGGQQQVEVPDLVGYLSAEDAATALSQVGLVLGTPIEKNSRQPAGYVLEQDPPAGTPVDAGATVTIAVSNGRVQVPDVIGQTETDARDALTRRGLIVTRVEVQDPTKPGGTVLAQLPVGGTQVLAGTQVTITVAALPPEPVLTVEPSFAPEPVPTEIAPTFAPEPQPSAPAPEPQPSTP